MIGASNCSFPDFCQRMLSQDLNKRVLESLIKCGAFDHMGAHRSQLLQVYAQVVDSIAQMRRSVLEGQMDLFGGDGDKPTEPAPMVLPKIAEFSRKELMNMERETTGLYLTGHPMDEYREEARRWRAVPIGSILSDFAGEEGGDTYRDGQKYAGAIHPDDRPILFAALDRQKRGEQTEMEYRIVRPDGDIRWIRSAAHSKVETGFLWNRREKSC